MLEVTTSCLYGKYGVEIGIWSLSDDNTQSWVRISHGSSFVKNYEDLTLKQMFDVTAQLVNNQEEIHGLDKNSLGKGFLQTSVTDW